MLKDAGVKVELNETKGVYHGYDIRPSSHRALAHRAGFFKKVFFKVILCSIGGF